MRCEDWGQRRALYYQRSHAVQHSCRKSPWLFQCELLRTKENCKCSSSRQSHISRAQESHCTGWLYWTALLSLWNILEGIACEEVGWELTGVRERHQEDGGAWQHLPGSADISLWYLQRASSGKSAHAVATPLCPPGCIWDWQDT